MPNELRVSDLGFAAYCAANGVRLVRVEALGERAVFVFDISPHRADVLRGAFARDHRARTLLNKRRSLVRAINQARSSPTGVLEARAVFPSWSAADHPGA